MTDHPISYEALIAIAFGETSPADAESNSMHVAECAECQSVIARFQLVKATVRLDAMPGPTADSVNRALNLVGTRGSQPQHRPFDALRRVFGTLTFDSRQAYAMSGLRGESDSYMLSYAQENATLDLEIEPSTSATSIDWHITGQLSVPGLSEPADIAILGGGGEYATTNSDEFGVFSFRVGPGRYDLLVSLEEVTLIFPEVEVSVRDGS